MLPVTRARNFFQWASDHSVLMIILILALIPFVLPYEALATQMIIWGLLALGYNILYGYTGLLSFGHAAYFGLGAYTTGIVLIRTNCSLLAGIGAGVLVSGIGAVVIGFFCLRRRGIYFALLTMAFAQMLYFTASIWESLTGGEPGLRNIPHPPLEIPGFVFLQYLHAPSLLFLRLGPHRDFPSAFEPDPRIPFWQSASRDP